MGDHAEHRTRFHCEHRLRGQDRPRSGAGAGWELGTLLIAVGAIEALWRTVAGDIGATLSTKKLVWVHFARWLMLGLEFQLAADILTTAVEPSWDDIGKLAAIAGIRTFPCFFLERDMETAVQYEETATQQARKPPKPCA